MISEDQIDELSSFFGEAENLSLDDRLDDARKVYQALFGLIEAFRESADVSLADAVLKQKKLKTEQRDEYLVWAEKIGKRRINHIVSNKYRNAYARAAQVLGSLVETYRVMDRDDKAKRLLHHFYNEKYNRFSAFRREVKTLVSASDLLKNLDF